MTNHHDNLNLSHTDLLHKQVQINYTRPDGMKCVRILTKTQRVTRDKRTAEKSISVSANVRSSLALFETYLLCFVRSCNMNIVPYM